MKTSKFLLILASAALFGLTGCTGWEIPQPISEKPWTYLKGSQFGRDQIANRTLVAYTKKIVLRGKAANEVLTILGQPQNIHVIERNVSEDWYFIYYKTYAAYTEVPYVEKSIPYPGKYTEGEFVVRLTNDKVTDVVTLN